MIFRSGITCITFSLLVLSACKSSPYKAATAELEHFLNTQLQRSIPERKHYFVLIPSNKCPKCISLDGNDYGKDFAARLTVVSSVDKENFRHLQDVVYDQDDQVLKLSFIDYAPKIVVSEKGAILSILDFNGNTQQLDSLYRLEAGTGVMAAAAPPEFREAAVSGIQTSTGTSIQTGY
jgi:hypothetical protein